MNQQIIHVMPVNDLREHTNKSCQCDCNPRIELVPVENSTPARNNIIVVHNSYDRREFKDLIKELAKHLELALDYIHNSDCTNPTWIRSAHEILERVNDLASMAARGFVTSEEMLAQLQESIDKAEQ